MAVSLFGEIQEAGLVPDVISHNVVIDACGREGHWQRALWHFAIEVLARLDWYHPLNRSPN